MKPSSWVCLTLGLIVLATLLQVAGVVAPMWIWLDPDNYTIGVGLFYRVGCKSSSGDVCPDVTEDLGFGYTDAKTYDKSYWPHLTWLQTMGAVLGILLTVMGCVYVIGFGVWKSLRWLNNALILTSIFTWLPIVAGLILYVIENGDVITKSPDVSSLSFPWSAVMCFIAAILFIIITILFGTKGRVRRLEKHVIPTSADNKMIMNPSTKSQLVNRFFSPMSAREDRPRALPYNSYTDQSALLGNGSATRSITNVYNNVNPALENSSEVHNTRTVNDGFRLSTRGIEAHTAALTPTNQDIVNRDQHQEQNVVSRVTTTTTTNQVGNEVEYNVGSQRFSYVQPTAPLEGYLDTRRQEDRIVASTVVLDRHQNFSNFDDGGFDDDAKTIYYTGIHNAPRHRALSVDTTRFANDPNDRLQLDTRQSMPSLNGQAGRDRGSLYRMGAGAGGNESLNTHILNTTHVRRDYASANGLVLAADNLRGSDPVYNNTHIYRPYSEQTY